MRKIKRTRRKNQKKKIIIVTLSLLLILTVGYAAFSTNLNITAKGNIKEYTAEDYVTDGLFAFYDGIENTKTGHGAPTDTWYNKALDLNPSIASAVPSTLNGVATSGWTSDNGLQFDGIDDVIDTGFLQEALGQKFTFSFVVYTTSNQAHRGYFGYHHATPNYIGLNMQFNGLVAVSYFGDGTACEISTNVGIDETFVNSNILNKKINITVVIDAPNRLALYINGKLMFDRKCTNSFDPYPNLNFMIYKKALTDSEINQIYKVNKQRYALQ